MTVNEVRQKYLEFFKKRGHIVIPSASLVPENDPTTLFTGSGMQPLVPYLLGQKHPQGTRLANSQKCFRSMDIEEVGDNRHTTFFEMLGNWSLGDYWKEEQLTWIFEFLTIELGIKKDRLWATCFDGDEKLGLLRDMESAQIWKELGIYEERVLFYGAEKNWWSRSGTGDKMPAGEPGGPDSEIFYDFGKELGLHEKSEWKNEKCHPNCDCGRFMEIGNSVFMEYRRSAEVKPPQEGGKLTSEGIFEKLPQRNVDFGGGLERITTAVNAEPDIFKLDVFATAIARWEEESGLHYSDLKQQAAFRVIADHTRAAGMLMENGIVPSNIGQGYVLRRLIRRAVLYADRLHVNIGGQFKVEGDKFRKTLKAGLQELQKILRQSELTPPLGKEELKSVISGKDAFLLFSSYGLPLDVTIDLAKEKGVTVDANGFQDEFRKHQEISRAGAEKKFKGGLADTSEMSVKYHTATHLLHQALRDVLGDEVRQKGSNITAERLRFDFAFSRKITEEEKKRVEDTVNEKIMLRIAVNKVVLPLAEAERTGALHFFGEKYGGEVNIYYIGDSLDSAYSKEFCGGPHVQNTGELSIAQNPDGTVGKGKKFRILKEEAVSQGIRRIKATLH